MECHSTAPRAIVIFSLRDGFLPVPHQESACIAPPPVVRHAFDAKRGCKVGVRCGAGSGCLREPRELDAGGKRVLCSRSTTDFTGPRFPALWPWLPDGLQELRQIATTVEWGGGD